MWLNNKYIYTGQFVASNVLCYECDSRYDPNCADPFDFSSLITVTRSDGQYLTTAPTNDNNKPEDLLSNNRNRQQQIQEPYTTLPNTTTTNSTSLQAKKLPTALVCHGCCVKITSKLPDGGL